MDDVQWQTCEVVCVCTVVQENMIRALELNDVYSQCKRQPIGGRRSVYECVADDKLKKVV